MTRWKRGVALLLVAAMTCSVAGCGSKKEETTTATVISQMEWVTLPVTQMAVR